MSGNKWTQEEVDRLKKYSMGNTYEELAKMFPNRTKIAVSAKCKELKLNKNIIKEKRKSSWNNEEIELLKKYYPHINEYGYKKFFPDRSFQEIRQRAKYMGLTKHSRKLYDYSDDDNIICMYCGKNYKKSDDRFYISNNNISRDCKDCHNLLNMIRDYKRKYSIDLDFDKMLDTYDIIQWYKWTVLEPTPSGKYLAQIPSSLITYDNIGTIVRYVVQDILGWKTREEITLLTQPIMSRYKIEFSKTAGIKNSPLALLSLAFPELHIKGWEMVHTPTNYWDDYNNLLECATHYYYNILDMSLKDNYLYFTDKYISELFYKLYRGKKHKHNHLTWKEIFNDIGISIPISDKCITYDGNILNSIEEVEIYNFIHQRLHIKTLKHISTKRKHKYIFENINNGIDNFYCPDFYIEYINTIKLTKPLIIEYYGLYAERNTHHIFVDYIKKTKRKNEFYKNNTDIHFIDLYPEDLKNDFEGVRNKLTPFIMQKKGSD